MLSCPPPRRRNLDQHPSPPRLRSTPDQIVDFSADTVAYDGDADVVTASGEVRMNREGNYLAADQVVWNRKSGEVRASGNVVVLTPQGDKLVGDNVVLTDTLQDGTVDNLLVVLESGGRIAARRGTRKGEITTLENAIYSPCPVTTDTGCPKRPSWAITAARVIDDPAHQPRPVRRRPPAALRRHPSAAPDLQHRARHRGRDRLAGAGLQPFDQEGL